MNKNSNLSIINAKCMRKYAVILNISKSLYFMNF